MKYTQTTTADEPDRKDTNPILDYFEQPNTPNNLRNMWLVFIGYIIVSCILYYVFYRQGRSESEAEQAIKATQAKIDTIYVEKEVRATNILKQSNKASKDSKIIRQGVIVNVPEYKTTSEDSMIQYLKQLKP